MSTVKFDYNDVATIQSSIKGTVGTISEGLESMNGGYEAVVQVPGGAIYGSLGAQLLLNWDNVSSSFPSFINNFDNWGAVIASAHGNYNEMEQKVTGFREGNRFGYSQTLTQRGMQAAANAYAAENGTTPTTVTAEDALNEIRGNGTDQANQYAASSPIRSSEVAGYDSENLPTYRSLEVATGATQTDDGTRSVVQRYSEADAYAGTGTTVTEEQPNEAANRIGETTLGEAPERKQAAPEGEQPADGEAGEQNQPEAEPDSRADGQPEQPAEPEQPEHPEEPEAPLGPNGEKPGERGPNGEEPPEAEG